MKDNVREFWFNTGTKIYDFNPPLPLMKYQLDSGNGVKVIQFWCKNVPQGATFLFASDYIDREKLTEGVIVRKIIKGGLLSKYAYFKIKN